MFYILKSYQRPTRLQQWVDKGGTQHTYKQIWQSAIRILSTTTLFVRYNTRRDLGQRQEQCDHIHGSFLMGDQPAVRGHCWLVSAQTWGQWTLLNLPKDNIILRITFRSFHQTRWNIEVSPIMSERVCEEPPWLVSVERVNGKRGTDRVDQNFT